MMPLDRRVLPEKKSTYVGLFQIEKSEKFSTLTEAPKGLVDKTCLPGLLHKKYTYFWCVSPKTGRTEQLRKLGNSLWTT